MAFNGSGSFTPDGSYFPVVSGSLIESAKFNGTINDLASGLSNCLTKDGQQTVTANLAMSGYRHTGVGDGATRTDYASVGQVQDGGALWAGTAGGTANAITLTLSPAISAYTAGQSFKYKSGASANTSTMTVAVSGLTAKAIQKDGAAVASGDHPANKWFRITYDGAAFQLEQIAPISAAVTTALALKATTASVALKADLASPALTGTPTAPTASATTDTTQIATTAHVLDRLQLAPAFRAAQAISQSLTTATPTKITLGTEEIDTASCFASSRFTPTVAGYYQLNWLVSVTGSTITDGYSMLYINGVEGDRGNQLTGPSTITVFGSRGSGVFSLNGSTDYVEIYANYTGTVLSATYSRFSGCLIRPL